MMEKTTTARQSYLDNIRALAILFIVIDHASMVGYRLFYSENNEIYSSMSNAGRYSMCFLWELSRLGVPLFLMITGALLINKEYDTEEKKKLFYKKNLLHLVAINYIWIVLYWIIAYLFVHNGIEYVYTELTNVDFSIKEFVYQLCWLKRASYPNMWYIPMVIGIYIFIPLISENIKAEYNINKKRFIFILLIPIMTTFLVTDVNVYRIYINEKTIRSVILPQIFGIYAIYMMVGFVIAKLEIKSKASLPMLLALGGIMVSCTVFMKETYDAGKPVKIFENNDSFLQLLCVVFIFALIKMKLNKRNIFLEFISKKSFVIFLMHFPVIHVLNFFFEKKYGGCTSYTIMLIFGAFTICLLIAKIIPVNRVTKLIFHIQ